jgi:hypothetical protein
MNRTSSKDATTTLLNAYQAQGALPRAKRISRSTPASR